jgi:ubiquinone/menaquinone biosynthesis C-methylase UbiE
LRVPPEPGVRVRSDPYKQAAVECWSADPCGAVISEGELGTKEYFERLMAARAAYAPWMEHALGYSATTGLDVLDVGCGQGIDLARYAMARARVVGIDLTPRHVQLARQHLEALELPGNALVSDAEALPFADHSFDRVSSNGVLHHTPHIALALKDMRRVLRPGGEARVILYNRNSLHFWLAQVAYRGILRGGLLRERSIAGVLSSGVEYSHIGARPLVRVYSPAQTRHLMRDAGFKRVRVEVYHFKYGDTPVTALLGRLVEGFRNARVLERIGRVGGWYVVGRGSTE